MKEHWNKCKSITVVGLMMLVALPNMITAAQKNAGDSNSVLVPHPIFGSAQYDQGGGNADGATVEVCSSVSRLTTIVGPAGGWASGLWQVDCGDIPGPVWPPGTAFTVWINGTGDHAGYQGIATGTVSGVYNDMGLIILTPIPINSPPEFGTPNPANETINMSLNFPWSIPISDPEGNPFTWTIQCSNGQTSGATNAGNGTKTLTLTGLHGNTSYIIWVNATDPHPPGSGNYTRQWYTFTTQNNSAPNVPQKPIGPPMIIPGVVCTFTTSTEDPDGDDVYYNWSWGDGSETDMVGPFTSGSDASATHFWSWGSNICVKVKAIDIHGAESGWSEVTILSLPQSPVSMRLIVGFLEQHPYAFPVLRHLLRY